MVEEHVSYSVVVPHALISLLALNNQLAFALVVLHPYMQHNSKFLVHYDAQPLSYLCPSPSKAPHYTHTHQAGDIGVMEYPLAWPINLT